MHIGDNLGEMYKTFSKAFYNHYGLASMSNICTITSESAACADVEPKQHPLTNLWILSVNQIKNFKYLCTSSHHDHIYCWLYDMQYQCINVISLVPLNLLLSQNKV